MHPTTDDPGPRQPGERLVVIDAIRGLALLGILLVNAPYFAMPTAWADDPLFYGDPSRTDLAVWSVLEVLATGKFITLFAVLFGAGVWLMTSRADAGDRPARGLHYRRMAWLLIFGLIHAYLVWYGDILVMYALCGMALYPMRRWSVSSQLAAALGFMLLSTLLLAAWGGLFKLWEIAEPADFADFEMYPQEGIDAELAGYRGDVLDQIAVRFPATLGLQFIMLFAFAPAYFALMLLGMVLVRTGILGGGRPRRFYRGVAAAGLTLGLPLALAVHLWERSQEAPHMARMMLLFAAQLWIAPLLSFAYAAGLVLLVQRGVLPWLTDALAAVGRMALTNYLLQSLVFTFIFYGHGLGLFATLDRVQLLPLIAGTWLAQLIGSRLWLAHFRFGPMEWVWRTLTYRSPQPMRQLSPAN